MRHALRQAARVDEDQRGAVRADQIGHAVVDLVPHLVGGDGAQLVARHFDRQFHIAAMAHVDDAARVAQERATSSIGFTVAERPMRCGRGPAVLFHQPVEARQRQRQVRAALVVGHGVDLVDDQVRTCASISRGLAAVSRM
jgi:hypothetical protein